MTIYTLANVTKVYKNKTVLNIRSLKIKKGYIYALIGPNGAGKSTLLNILGFLELPSSGTIYYRSSPVIFSQKKICPLRKEIVVVNQHPIFFSTTVYKNIELGLKIRKFSKKKRDKIIEESLDLVGMRHMVKAMAQKLSGGETQRIAIARAVALSPNVILCDEPTSSVDSENQIIIANLLKQINEQKKTTLIFTSHNRFQTAFLAHQTFFINNGEITFASYENLFAAKVILKGQEFSKCIIENTLNLTIIAHKVGCIRLLIDPEKIYICEFKEEKFANNSLYARVVQISEEKEKVRIMVFSRINITVIVSADKYKATNPLIGDMIRIYIPPEAIKILS